MSRFVSNPNPPHNFIPYEEYLKLQPKVERGPLIFGDLPDVLSPIDSTVIHGRRGFREHFKRHNVTWTEDFRQEWQTEKKEREQRFTNPQARRERVNDIKNAIEKGRRK